MEGPVEGPCSIPWLCLQHGHHQPMLCRPERFQGSREGAQYPRGLRRLETAANSLGLNSQGANRGTGALQPHGGTGHEGRATCPWGAQWLPSLSAAFKNLKLLGEAPIQLTSELHGGQPKVEGSTWPHTPDIWVGMQPTPPVLARLQWGNAQGLPPLPWWLHTLSSDP